MLQAPSKVDIPRDDTLTVLNLGNYQDFPEISLTFHQNLGEIGRVLGRDEIWPEGIEKTLPRSYE